MLFLYLAALDNDDDRNKMEEIYNEYSHKMLWYAISIFKNKELAEDAVHNAFLSIIKHKEKFFQISGRELQSQIVIITKNKCLDILRKDSKIADVEFEDISYFLQSDDAPMDEQMILNDEYMELRKHMAALDESSRAVLEMCYVLGMSYKEIGAELGITPKHVDTKIMRAKEKIRKLMAKEGSANE